jgi:hypothetical protein
LPYIPESWEWTWLVSGKADYVGTFPKRLSKFFFQSHGIKCPTSFMQALGNLARQHSADAITYTFDFTDTFDWDDGDFGDSGSCYWSDRTAALGMLAENAALAIRFYADASGFARAWVAQLSEKRYIVFNGYGIETRKIAHIMATWLGLGYKKIRLANNGETAGMLWINGDSGYLIGTSEQTAALERHDLGFDCSECYACDYCGNTMNEDDSYSTPNGESYCQSCFYDHYDYCYYCDSTVYRDDMTYVDDNDVCDSCFDKHYFTCETCHTNRPNRHKLEDKDYCLICKPLPDEN